MDEDDEILDYAAILPKVIRRFKVIKLEDCERRVAAEREACAKLLEDLHDSIPETDDDGGYLYLGAAKIRARTTY